MRLIRVGREDWWRVSSFNDTPVTNHYPTHQQHYKLKGMSTTVFVLTATNIWLLSLTGFKTFHSSVITIYHTIVAKILAIQLNNSVHHYRVSYLVNNQPASQPLVQLEGSSLPFIISSCPVESYSWTGEVEPRSERAGQVGVKFYICNIIWTSFSRSRLNI